MTDAVETPTSCSIRRRGSRHWVDAVAGVLDVDSARLRAELHAAADDRVRGHDHGSLGLDEATDESRLVLGDSSDDEGAATLPTDSANLSRPEVGPTMVDADGLRTTVITRVDGSQLVVRVPKGAMKHRIYDPWPRDKYDIRIEEVSR